LDATDIKKSAIWDDLGRNEPGKCFTQGPFVNWTSTINGQHCVTRNIKLDGGSPFLMTATEVFKTAIRNIGNFSTYQKWISEVHNHFHKGIGGDMRLISFSAGDPIFYLHHAYVDKLWADWQRYDPQKRLKQYNGKNYGNITVSLSDIIQPYGVTVESVMNTRQLCYMYLPPGSRFDGPRNKPPRSQSHSHTKTPAAASRTTKKAASTSSSRSTTTTPPPSNATKQQQPVVVKKRDSSGIVMPQIPPQLPQEFYIVNNMTSMNGSAMHEMTRHFYQLTYEELKSGKYLGGPGTGPDPSPPSIPYGHSAFGGPAPYSRITVQSVSDYVVPADQIQQVAKQVYPHRSYNFGTEDSAAGSLNHGGGYFILSMELCLGILIYIVQT
jgi:hypothetical protein